MPSNISKLMLCFFFPGAIVVAILIDGLRLSGWNEWPNDVDSISIAITFLIIFAYLLGLVIYQVAYYGFQSLHRHFRLITICHDINKRNLDSAVTSRLRSIGIPDQRILNSEEFIQENRNEIVMLSEATLLRHKLLHLLCRFFIPILPPFNQFHRINTIWSREFNSKLNSSIPPHPYDIFDTIRTSCYIKAGPEWIQRIEYTWQLFRLSLTTKWAIFFALLYCIGVLVVCYTTTWDLPNGQGLDIKYYVIGIAVFWTLSISLNAHSWNRHRGLIRDFLIGFVTL